MDDPGANASTFVQEATISLLASKEITKIKRSKKKKSIYINLYCSISDDFRHMICCLWLLFIINGESYKLK